MGRGLRVSPADVTPGLEGRSRQGRLKRWWFWTSTCLGKGNEATTPTKREEEEDGRALTATNETSHRGEFKRLALKTRHFITPFYECYLLQKKFLSTLTK